jgi:RHS repeat-associated protein
LHDDKQAYNAFGEPERQTSVVGSTPVFDVQIARDHLGRITQRIEVVDGITRLFQYGYDLAGRLQTVTRDSTLVARYTYDANGNRLTAEGEAHGGGLPITATYDDQDRLLTYGNASCTYTANGELATKTVNGQTTSYVYDTLGNLVTVTQPNGDVISYTIDGRGRRVGKSINGVRVRGWLYADQLRPIAELDGDGNVVSRFVYGTKVNVPEYMIREGVTYRIFSDHLGSPRVVVNTSTGQIVQRMDFHAFGEIIQDSNPGWQPFGFAGGLQDADTGLARFGTRDYFPLSGRWLSRDGVLFIGGTENLYEYSLQDPQNAIDPSGNVPLAALIPVVGGLVGGGIEAYAAAASGGNVVGAFASGFVSGAVGSLAAMGAASVPGVGVAVAGAVGGVAGSLTSGLLSGGPLNAAELAVGTVAGAATSAVAAKLLPTVGRLPDLLKLRDISNFGKNSQRLVGQEAASGAMGGGFGAIFGGLLCK